MDLLGPWRPAARRPRESGLRGAGQLRNACGALTVVDLLGPRLPVSMQAVRRGLIELDLPGAFRCCPGGRQSSSTWRTIHRRWRPGRQTRDMAFFARTIAVVGMLADKDIAGSLAPLAGKVDHWLLADLDVPRGASAAALAASRAARRSAARSNALLRRPEAFARSAELAGENDRILVFGSFYTVAAVMRSMQNGR
jgi:dihydrofolate synthase/folylpolyglutamate synthase